MVNEATVVISFGLEPFCLRGRRRDGRDGETRHKTVHQKTAHLPRAEAPPEEFKAVLKLERFRLESRVKSSLRCVPLVKEID